MSVAFRRAEYRIGGTPLIGPLDFEVRRGTCVVLLGRSGSGKTTTLRLVNALLLPSAGEVVVEGMATTAWDPVRLRRSIGYVIQEIGLFPHCTVAENIALVPRLERWSTARIDSRVTMLLGMAGLPPLEFAGRHPHELSGGQRQRVGLARALAADPPMLLCDEPFGAVDPVTRSQLQREFRALIQRLGKTVMFVTHDVDEALLLGDTIMLMEGGRVVFSGSVHEFRTADDEVVRAFRGDRELS